MREKSC
jgi:hypothetical protein